MFIAVAVIQGVAQHPVTHLILRIKSNAHSMCAQEQISTHAER
jgi:hypothetical protein